MQEGRLSTLAATLHGGYYILTGIWPILDRKSFEKITGPKYDFWLVRTTGALISAIGGALLLAGLRREVTAQTALLGLGSAVSLAGSDMIYASKGRIRRVYLLESLAEIGLIGLWLLGLAANRRDR